MLRRSVGLFSVRNNYCSLVKQSSRNCKHSAAVNLEKHLDDDEFPIKNFVDDLSDKSRRSLLAALVMKEENLHGKQICPQTFFEQADTNGDGVLNVDEFSSWVRSRSWFGPTINSGNGNQKTTNLTEVETPSNKQLLALFIQVSIPFVGFGFLDNAIMISAGSTIEQSIGVTLGLSTLAAAGLGNLLSDVAGIGLGNTIEMASHKLGLPDPKLSAKQARSSYVRWVRLAASVVGIAIGCILGLFPLLFVQSKEEARLRRIFDQMDTNGNGEIDFNELQSALETIGLTVPEATLRSFFDFIDIDHDGVINFEEFCYLVEHMKSMLDPISKSNPHPSIS